MVRKGRWLLCVIYAVSKIHPLKKEVFENFSDQIDSSTQVVNLEETTRMSRSLTTKYKCSEPRLKRTATTS